MIVSEHQSHHTAPSHVCRSFRNRSNAVKQYVTALLQLWYYYNYNYNYKMAPSKQGAGGGSATHKEPT